MGAVRLVETVGEAARDQGQVGALDAEHELRGGGHVRDRVADGHVRGHRGARLLGRHLVCRDHQHTLDAFGGIQANGAGPLVAVGLRADDEASVERRADVVGVALELDGAGVDLLALEPQLEQVVGGHQPGDDRRRRRAEAAGERDLAANLEPQAVGGMKRLEGSHAQVAAVVRDRLVARVN